MYKKPTIINSEVKCEICQKFFSRLSAHIKKHGLSAIDYRVHCNYKLSQNLDTAKKTNGFPFAYSQKNFKSLKKLSYII